MPSYEGFKRQLLELEPGERLSYHIGNLTRDRQRQSTVHKIAILAKGLELMSRVTLTAQKLDRHSTAYYVTLFAVPARKLQAIELIRAWTLGQENLAPAER